MSSAVMPKQSTIGTAPSSWTVGTGAYAGVAWLPGGNNDMLHGIDYGFLAAEQVLPQGHAQNENEENRHRQKNHDRASVSEQQSQIFFG